ncbi:MAG: hypothetical protein M3256_09770 [Actinomycetota bacterium]|nr:hypothetical protein [Candidatus Dormibacteraeota bacterium]MDQ6946541.1 hypothetical protein [Actinomycetota bacterium]
MSQISTAAGQVHDLEDRLALIRHEVTLDSINRELAWQGREKAEGRKLMERLSRSEP